MTSIPSDLQTRTSNSTPAVKQGSVYIPLAWQRKTGPAKNMIESFYHAFHGIWLGLKYERNVRIHLASAVVVIILGTWLKVSVLDWALLAIAVGLVLVTEFLNTAIEHLVDLSSEGEYHDLARFSKDTSAAAVLFASIMALLIGCLVFLPKLMLYVHS